MKLSPILIGGCGRSGTTMLGSMLGSSDQCITTPESPFIVELYRQHKSDRDHPNRAQILEQIQKHDRFRIWGTSIDLAQLTQTKHPDETHDSFELLIYDLIHLYAQQNDRPRAKYWIDHTPWNLRYSQTLVHAFPDAKFIHLVRDGRAVCSSVLKLDWGPNTVISAARWWMLCVGEALAAESFFGPDRVFRVRYEDIIAAPEATLRSICEWAAIQYDDNMLSGRGLALPKFTKHQHKLVGSLPSRNRVDAWKTTLSAREITIFESLAGDFLQCFGYNLYSDEQIFCPTKLEHIRSLLTDLYYSNVYNRLRHRLRIWKSIRST